MRGPVAGHGSGPALEVRPHRCGPGVVDVGEAVLLGQLSGDQASPGVPCHPGVGGEGGDRAAHELRRLGAGQVEQLAARITASVRTRPGYRATAVTSRSASWAAMTATMRSSAAFATL